MKSLSFCKVSKVDTLAWPDDDQQYSLETSALEFFTDFEQATPLVIGSSTPAVDVKQLMLKAHAKLKIVLDHDGQFVGIISVDDLIDRHIVRMVSKGLKRSEILVRDLMRPKGDLVALDFHEVGKVSIAVVIRALKENGQQHCLVLEQRTHKIRGIFSASDISRKLNLAIDIQDRSSFYRVFSAVS